MTTSDLGQSNRMPYTIPLLVRALTVALLAGGLSGFVANLLFVPPGLWVWQMPVLACRFLAAAAFSYVVGSLVVLCSNRWVESELLLATVNFYGWPLLLAILIQADQVNWGDPIAWSFVAVLTPALVISIPYLWINRKRPASDGLYPVGSSLRVFLMIVGVAALLVGLLVFVAPRQAGFIWPWSELKAWGLLDSRLIASMLLTIGAGAFLVLWRNDRGAARVFLTMLAAYCIMADIGILLHALSTPAFVLQDTVYIVIFALIFVAGLVLYRGRLSTSRSLPTLNESA